MTDAALAVDAFVKFAYSIDLEEFREAMFPESHPEYVKEKFDLMQASLPSFWGVLDPENKERFVAVALVRRLVEEPY